MSELLPTKVKVNSDDYKRNSEHNRALAHELEERIAKAKEGGGEKYMARHRQQNKLFVRERVELLLDPGTPWLEFSTLAGWELYPESYTPSGGIAPLGTPS